VHAVIAPPSHRDHYRFLARRCVWWPQHGRMFKLMDRARVRIERVEDEVYVSLVGHAL
jgi:hypothetical protein